MEPSSRYLVANGLRHHVLEWNPEGQTTALCLHGFLDLSWGFVPVAERLAAAGYHVLAPDLRGHGDTERAGPGGYYHFADYLPDVDDLVRALCHERVLLIGHSMGGAVATYYAGTFPARIWRLVCMEGTHVPEFDYEGLPARVAEWVSSTRSARQRGQGAYATVEDAARRLRAVDRRCPEALALYLATHGTRRTEAGLVFKHDPLHLTRGPYPYRLEYARPFWKQISCPTLFIEGAESEFLALPNAEERYTHFARRAVVRIPDAGHMMIRHQPGAVADAILSFITQEDA